jgi:hypothetical protein
VNDSVKKKVHVLGVLMLALQKGLNHNDYFWTNTPLFLRNKALTLLMPKKLFFVPQK